MSRHKRKHSLSDIEEAAFVSAAGAYIEAMRAPMMALHAHGDTYREIARSHEAVHRAIRAVTGKGLPSTDIPEAPSSYQARLAEERGE